MKSKITTNQYIILGNDGKERGPLTRVQVRREIRERLLEKKTPVMAAGAKDWDFLHHLPEFKDDFARFDVTSSSPRQVRGSLVVLLILSALAAAGFWAWTRFYTP